MSSVRLRPWQHAALARFNAANEPDFLAVATPGSGKTLLALTAIRQFLAVSPRRVVVVTPTAHLKRQWSEAATRLGLHLDSAWSASGGRLPADMHGVVVTYQQVAATPASVGRLAERAFVVLDEVHHAAQERAWGDALRAAFDAAAVRLSLSGTPFRSDVQPIPFVRYEDGQAVPDYEYGYAEALREGGVVRPVYFPRIGGRMEWIASNGEQHAASFDDDLAGSLANQRLRTALSLDGEWLPSVLGDAVAQLAEVRRIYPDAGGLVIAADQAHARGIAALLYEHYGVSQPVVATSDDPEASEHIARFAAGRSPWLVAVRMVSEGVDIPRLRVGVFATPTTTELFFRQAVGRIVRWIPGLRGQRAWLFLPDDVRLRWYASRIAAARYHWIVQSQIEEEAEESVLLENLTEEEEAERLAQMSLFAPVSAIATGTDQLSPWHEALPEPANDQCIDLELAPLAFGGSTAPEPGITRRQTKDALRLSNASVARALARHTGLTHAHINAELNRRVGLQKVSEATLVQLQARLTAGRTWLASA